MKENPCNIYIKHANITPRLGTGSLATFPRALGSAKGPERCVGMFGLGFSKALPYTIVMKLIMLPKAMKKFSVDYSQFAAELRTAVIII